jgi:two-component system response regulator QseB
MRVLLVEDDQMLGKAVKNVLEINSYVVDLVDDAESCETALKTTNFDMILLDINLPDKSGLEILRSLRSKKNLTPVLILTARDLVTQRIEGLDLGADDYLTKPFDLNELLARIRSITRRAGGNLSPVISHRDIALDTVSYSVTKDGKKIETSPKEFFILKLLLENLGKVVSRVKLEDSLYSWENSVESNAVEVHIHHLRKKFGTDLIKTIRGIGYLIEK